ncbi:MAG TPA: hypothetical protein VMU48_01190 [Terracidiphilus sp.]|nr:hypothetical protein [Terracidiphilus sp.]
MPLLNRSTKHSERAASPDSLGVEPEFVERANVADVKSRSSLFATCANPGCRSGWLHVWRRTSAPVFEGGWSCSIECTRDRIALAVRRECEGRSISTEDHRHRIPLGLLMLEQGWITQDQLREALQAQRSAGKGRLGQWLVAHGAVEESMVTRALALQWSCPVLPLERNAPCRLASVMPRLFLDAFGALPIRVAAGKVLYLGFEEGLDRTLALATERMTGLRVESGVVQESNFRRVHEHLLKQPFPHIELVEAVSEMAASHVLAKSVERLRPVASRLVRVHDCLWLRMWLLPLLNPLPEIDSVYDIVCSIGTDFHL